MKGRVYPLMIFDFIYTIRALVMDEKRNRDISYADAIGIVWDIVITVLVTTIFFAFGGRWLDNHFGTNWIFTTIGFALLILIGTGLLLKKGQRIANLLDGKDGHAHTEKT